MKCCMRKYGPIKNHGKEERCNQKNLEECCHSSNAMLRVVEGAVVVLGVAVCLSRFWVLLDEIWMPPVQQATKPTKHLP